MGQTSPLPWLASDNLEFPDISEAWEEPNGLLAAGGDLSPARLIKAYTQGVFPWYEDGQPILWWSPEPRMLLLPQEIHVSRSLKKVLRKGLFQVTLDQAFAEVIEQCSLPRQGQRGTWITRAMKQAYIELHRLQVAHSFEVWQNKTLVGGIYGVAIGRAFFGESMFSRVANASKVALVSLTHQLRRWDFGFIDCQMDTQHLRSMGARNVPREQFRRLLLHYTEIDPVATPWRVCPTLESYFSESPGN